MKKLLLFSCMLLAVAFSASAQLPYAQNFESTTTSLPTGWSVGVASHHPGNPGWGFNNAWPSHGNSLWQNLTATHTYCAFVDDVDYDYTGATWTNSHPFTTGGGDYDTLYTSNFSCAAATSVYVSFDLNFNNYTGDEVGTIAVSTDAAHHIWTTAATLPVYNGDVSWHNGLLYDISSLAGGQSNVMVAFCWNDNIAATNDGAPGWGMAVDNIDVYAPPAYDLAAVNVSNQYLVQTSTPVTFSGTEFNWGGTTITSMHMNYTVNGGPVQSDPITSISLTSLGSYNFTHTTNWTPSTPGNYLVKFWADHINGSNADLNNANDTLYSYYTVIDTLQTKMALFEEYMQASCNPCMYAAPNIEPVLNSAQGYCNSFRYHVDWPGVDYMNNETQTPFVNSRVGYYGVSGVPDGLIDGTTQVDPGAVQNSDIQNVLTIGSPFKIDITSCAYNRSTNTYSLSANIKSFATFPEGIVARVVLSVDTIKYDSNQSDEDPTSSFPGTNPWSYYQYVKDFPQVAEDMLPSSSGTVLSPFADGQTQTINVSWHKNHPWGQTPKAHNFGYDSLSTVSSTHMTVFLQEDQAAPNTYQTIPAGSYPSHAKSGALTNYVYQSASSVVSGEPLGLPKISDGVYFQMYPNPTNSVTNLAFKLDASQEVNIEVYNMLGEKVYSEDKGKLGAGQYMVPINGENLQSGVYIVRFNTDNSTTTQKLVIQK